MEMMPLDNPFHLFVIRPVGKPGLQPVGFLSGFHIPYIVCAGKDKLNKPENDFETGYSTAKF
jgi:hypothetical protein